jgi:hypothetical protein
MPTPIGVNTVTSVVSRYLLPEMVDNVYKSNPIIYRLMQGNKKVVQGGTHIEQPVILSDFNAGDFYTGYDLLSMVPQDTMRTAGWDWKQAYVPLVFSGLTLAKADSPDAIANIVQQQSSQANLRMAEVLANSLWATTTSALGLDGVPAMVDDGTLAGTYGALSRTTYTNWKAFREGGSGALTIPRLNTTFTSAQYGGRTPSIIASGQAGYNAYYNLAFGTASLTSFNVSAGSGDANLFGAGFQNVLFNGVPWIADSHIKVDPTSGQSGKEAIFMLNEDFVRLIINARGDWVMEDFQTPPDQDVVSSKLLWMGNVINQSPRTSAVIPNWS